MHRQAKEFCERVRTLFPEQFKGKALDVGSLDINGSNRYLFEGSYIGLDIGEGKNVDIVCPVSEYKTRERFDVVISTEMLEHDRTWRESLVKMQQLTKRGGVLVITCATTGRPEHGTSRTDAYSSPFTIDYYQNLTEDDFREAMNLDGWDYHFETETTHKDLYFWGVKP